MADRCGPALFRTVVPLQPLPVRIGCGEIIFYAGSCFACTVGSRLAAYKCDVCGNPFGTLYNPHSLARMFGRVCGNEPFSTRDLFEHGGLWRSFDAHTTCGAPDLQEALALLNQQRTRAFRTLAKARVCLLTVGTAFCYRHRATGRIVANCHTLPHHQFSRELLSIEEITRSLTQVCDACTTLSPDLQCVLSVSPVRHLRDDPHENSISKARLLCGVHEVVSARANCHYFPAWEIFMDELRDYRFYDRDMTHPAPVAEEYIWDAFCRTCTTPAFRAFYRAYESIRTGCAHRVTHPCSPATRDFAYKNLEQVERLAARYPEFDFSTERQHFSRLCAS